MGQCLSICNSEKLEKQEKQKEQKEQKEQPGSTKSVSTSPAQRDLDWELCTKDTVPMYSIVGLREAKVIDIYDGDTITCALRMADGIYAYHVRLQGIDTPELKVAKGDKQHDQKKEKALAAKVALMHLLPEDRIVKLDCHGFEKFGRILANVILPDGTDVSQRLIKDGHGHPYDGGHKLGWDS